MNDWEARYQQGSTGWDRGAVNPALIQWLDEGVLQPCRILVPGCGFGYEVCELASRGYDVTAVDIAPSAVTHLKQCLQQQGLTATVLEADLFSLDLGTFDAIYEQTCLCALPPVAWSTYTAWLHRHLQVDSLLLALFMQTGKEGGPPFHCGIENMRAIFAEDSWMWPDKPSLESSHHHGRFEVGMLLRPCKRGEV